MTNDVSAVARIRAVLGNLVASERRVAMVVLADPHAVIRMTAAELGALADTSATTVIRFARNAGFAGFNELAISLIVSDRPTAPTASTEIDADATPGATLSGMAEVARDALRACEQTVDSASLELAIDTIARGRNVLCLGSGLTGPVAEDLAIRLNYVGIAADAPADRHVQWIKAMQLTDDDVCIAILQGGTYAPIVTTAKRARESGATVIALTAFEGTPIVEASDIALVTGSSEVRNGIAAWSVRLQLLLVVDALIASLARVDDGETIALTGAEVTGLIEQAML